MAELSEEQKAKYRRAAERKMRRSKKYRKSVLILSVTLLLVLLAAFAALLKFDPGRKKRHGADFSPREPSQSLCVCCPELIPDFDGHDYAVLLDNRPLFTKYDLTHITGENYSELDLLGRCGTACAMIDKSMKPREGRGYIGMIEPSGWVQAKYEGYVDSSPPYLFNRCHLLPFALTGQNANEKNLITGTRYMNAVAMLGFEKIVMEFLDYSDQHVLYRVTPYFKDRELVARGVEMEAYSVEDRGESVCFHVFVYNYQPGIEIDYRTGQSRIKTAD